MLTAETALPHPIGCTLPGNRPLAIANVLVKDVDWKNIDSISKEEASYKFATCNKKTFLQLTCNPLTILRGKRTKQSAPKLVQ